MKNIERTVSLTALTLLAAIATPQIAQAHCDSLDGPVVHAARAALAESNVDLVLIWVLKDDDAAIRQAFERTLAVRKLNPEAKPSTASASSLRKSWPKRNSTRTTSKLAANS